MCNVHRGLFVDVWGMVAVAQAQAICTSWQNISSVYDYRQAGKHAHTSD